MRGRRSLSRKWMAIESDPGLLWLSYLFGTLEKRLNADDTVCVWKHTDQSTVLDFDLKQMKGKETHSKLSAAAHCVCVLIDGMLA